MHSGTHFAQSFRMSKSLWMMDPTRSREMPSCSADGLPEIRRSSQISSWIWTIIFGVVTVLGRPGRGASQVEKWSRLNWPTQFLTVAYVGACTSSVYIRMAWIFFGACLAEKKTWWNLASRCCWNRVRRLAYFLSTSVTRKYLQFGTWTDPSFQRHYRFRPTALGSRSVDLSVPPRMSLRHRICTSLWRRWGQWLFVLWFSWQWNTAVKNTWRIKP